MADFKTLWALKEVQIKKSTRPKIDITSLLKVNYKLEPKIRKGFVNRYTIKQLFQEYAYDLVSYIIRMKFKTIPDYFAFSKKHLKSLGNQLLMSINEKLSKDCPLVLKRIFLSNDSPEEKTRAALTINTVIQRDINLIKEIGPILKRYPEALQYLQLKFAENNSSKISSYIFNSGSIPYKK